MKSRLSLSLLPVNSSKLVFLLLYEYIRRTMNQPKYRRPLNGKQLTILSTIYRFRFVTSPLISRLLNIKQSKAHERLTILLEQKYIGRRYDKTYRLQGRAAAYYLLPKGAKALGTTENEKYLPEVLTRLAKDECRSDRFVNHWLGVLGIYCELKAGYGERLSFFTNTELVPHKYFIQPRPDAYLRIDKGANERQFFLDYLESSMPRFAMQSRVRQYVEYAEEEDWQENTKTTFPRVILVYDNPRLKSKLKRMVREALDDSFVEDEFECRIALAGELIATVH